MRFVGESLRALALDGPGCPAVSCDKDILTRAEFLERVLRTAEEFSARCAPKSRVALDLKRPDDLLIAFFAASLSGRVATIFDPAWPETRRKWVTRQVAPGLVIADDVLQDWLSRPAAGGVTAAAPAPEDPFYIGFTSGSTGTPKGYCRSHRSWTSSFDVSDREFPITAADRVLVPGSLIHSLHLYGAVEGICAGARVTVARDFNPRHLARVLRQQKISVLYGTPTQVQLLARELQADGPLGSLRLLLVSGAKWQERGRRQIAGLFPNADLVEFYGASEMSFVALARPEEAVPAESVGRAASGVRIEIRDGAGAVLPRGVPGRIWVASDLLFDGYVCGGGTEIRREGRWLTVGDHGHLDRHGFLYLAGREKRMLVTAGVNLYPEEVEKILAAQPEVADAAVFGEPDSVRGTVVVAAVRAARGATPDPDRLRRTCRAELGLAATPKKIRVLEDWPLTAGGKTDLEALKDRFAMSGTAG